MRCSATTELGPVRGGVTRVTVTHDTTDASQLAL